MVGRGFSSLFSTAASIPSAVEVSEGVISAEEVSERLALKPTATATAAAALGLVPPNTFPLVPLPPQEGRPMLLISVGTRGLVPMRALLNWTPIQVGRGCCLSVGS